MFMEKIKILQRELLKNLCQLRLYQMKCTIKGHKILSISLFKFLKDVKIDNFFVIERALRCSHRPSPV